MTTETRNGQTEYEILTRAGIPLVLGEKEWRVRPRVMQGDREWLADVQVRLMRRFGTLDSADSIPGIIAALGDATEDMVDLILAYDETSGLPPREWIEGNAHTREVTMAFTVLLEEAYPPFGIGRKLIPGDRATGIIGRLIGWALERALEGSPSPGPSKSPSTSGDSETPKRSRRPSRTGSSKS